MFDDDYTTPEGFYLPRPLLMPEARAFSDVLEYVREWEHNTMSHTSGKVPRPDLVPEPRYIDADGPGARALEGIAVIAGLCSRQSQARNTIGPYCSVDLRHIGGPAHRGIAVRATDATMEAIAPRIVTPDDTLSFQVIAHAERNRALVIASHGYIIGSHWLAYIDPATIPSYPYAARDNALSELASELRAGGHVPFRRDLGEGMVEYTSRTLPGFRATVDHDGSIVRTRGRKVTV